MFDPNIVDFVESVTDECNDIWDIISDAEMPYEDTMRIYLSGNEAADSVKHIALMCVMARMAFWNLINETELKGEPMNNEKEHNN